MKIKAFTLAEVLITITILGVVAALSIPSVITHHQQKEYKTGLKRALSTLNQAIALNIAMEDQTPYEAANTLGYFARHMNVIRSTTNLRDYNQGFATGTAVNAALWTADGMRFEFRVGGTTNYPHEAFDYVDNNGKTRHVAASNGTYYIAGSENYNIANPGQKVYACASQHSGRSVREIMDQNRHYDSQWEDDVGSVYDSCMGCGSNGLAFNPNNTTKPPCLIVVDVNGDRKPNPPNANCKFNSAAYRQYKNPNERGDDYQDPCVVNNGYKWTKSKDKKVNDLFRIMITDQGAYPWGTVAQKTMYGK